MGDSLQFLPLEKVSLITTKKCKGLKDDGMLRSINFYLLKKYLEAQTGLHR